MRKVRGSRREEHSEGIGVPLEAGGENVNQKNRYSWGMLYTS